MLSVLTDVARRAWLQEGTGGLLAWEAVRRLLNHGALAPPEFFEELYEEVEDKGFFDPEKTVEVYEWDLKQGSELARAFGHPQVEPVLPQMHGTLLTHRTCTRNTLVMLDLQGPGAVELYRANGVHLEPDCTPTPGRGPGPRSPWLRGRTAASPNE